MTPTLLAILCGAYLACLVAVLAFVHGAECRCPKCGKRYDEP